MILHFIILIQLVFSYAQPPALNFTLGDVEKINDFLPHGGYYPDGHISVIQEGNEFYAFWSEFESFRTVANTNDLRYHVGKLNPNKKVIGGRKNDDGSGSGETSWSDGGAWLMGVRKIRDGRLVGFFHAESHWYPRNNDYTAYKSVGMAYSNDNGATWTTNESFRVLTPPYEKPATRVWSGNGDGTVIWDPIQSRYLMYYTASRFLFNNPLLFQTESPKIAVASSSDETGWYNTWKKHDGKGFNQPSLGGYDTPLKNIDTVPGACPSVHFNIYLNRWIMVWYAWNPKYIYISSSFDGLNWALPQRLIADTPNLVYPNIVGVTHDIGGQKVRIYYGRELENAGKREILTREITFYN